MTNQHNQVTPDDFRAPLGQFRLMKEDMRDGELEIIADFHDRPWAERTLAFIREEDEENVFTLCDDAGNEIQPFS